MILAPLVLGGAISVILSEYAYRAGRRFGNWLHYLAVEREVALEGIPEIGQPPAEPRTRREFWRRADAEIARRNATNHEQIERAKRAAAQIKAESKPNAPRVVGALGYRVGERVRVTRRDTEGIWPALHMRAGVIEHIGLNGIMSVRMEEGGRTYYLTPEEVERTPPRYKVGDRVRRADDKRRGRVIGVGSFEDGAHRYEVRVEDRPLGHYNLTEFQIEPVPEFEVGDLVRSSDGIVGIIEGPGNNGHWKIKVLGDPQPYQRAPHHLTLIEKPLSLPRFEAPDAADHGPLFGMQALIDNPVRITSVLAAVQSMYETVQAARKAARKAALNEPTGPR